MMYKWDPARALELIEVDYEALVTDTENTVRRVLQYAGLSWNDACLDYFNRQAATATASAHQVREAPHRRSVGHWKHFAEQLRPLFQTLDETDD